MSSLQGILIVAGDFNCALDPKLDRSTGIDASHPQSRNIINQYIKDLNLSDVWRLQNPTKKEFSCYSSSFHTYSRIDYFLISKDLIDYISNCKYSSIVLSDHASLSLKYTLRTIIKSPSRWRLNIKWLHNPEFLDFVGNQIDIFFEFNTNQTSASIRWEV